MQNTPEGAVLKEHKALLDILKARGALDYFRVNVGGVMRGGRKCPNKDMAGFSDIIILTPTPCTIFLELKAAKTKQSDDQIEFQRRIEAAGHKYYVSRSKEDLCNILNSNGIQTSLFGI